MCDQRVRGSSSCQFKCQKLALTVHAVYARLIASERVGGLKDGAHYCWRTIGHSACATNKSEAAAAAILSAR